MRLDFRSIFPQFKKRVRALIFFWSLMHAARLFLICDLSGFDLFKLKSESYFFFCTVIMDTGIG